MRLNRKQAFGIAAIIAGIAAVLVYYLLSSSSTSRQAEQPQMVGVVMATTNIPPYAKIAPGMVAIKSVAITTAPSNAFTSPNQVIGRIAQYAISKGQLLVRGDVAIADATQGLTFVIPKGRRAVTVALDPISGVGGFVYPGDHVDVLATFEQNEVSSTRGILQNIEVLAINEQTVRPKNGSNAGETDSGTPIEHEAPVVEKVKSATLAVTPEEAQRLILAVYEGTIHMVLRSREDVNSIYDLAATTDWSLMGMAAPKPEKPEVVDPAAQQMMGWPPGYMAPPTAAPVAPAQPAASAAPTIEILRGPTREVVTTTR
ncbi:MAG: Flp pilus assembly protein CpaB [Chloroflexota bacterium]|nr:Flp pilus assembly protein CpaB [Chloroflexota bacterium]